MITLDDVLLGIRPNRGLLTEAQTAKALGMKKAHIRPDQILDAIEATEHCFGLLIAEIKRLREAQCSPN